MPDALNLLRMCAQLAACGLGLALRLGVPPAAPVLSIETVDVPWGEGTYHYVEELRLSAGRSAPLVLHSSIEHDVLAPIPGPRYSLGDRHVLLLGWSSTGGGAETLHALVLEVAPAGVRLQRHLTLTRDRGSSVLFVRRVAPAEILLGLLEPGAPWSISEEEGYSLVLGHAPRERLSWRRVRKLVYVAAEPRVTDYVYAPPFGSVINGALVRDGTVGQGLLRLPRFARPVPLAWLTVGPDRIALSAPPR
jgi:hypothetical protein